MDFFLCVIGMVLVVEGLPYFAMPEKMKAYFLRAQLLSDTQMRIAGLVAILLGLALVYWGRQ
ncbi:MAG: DUF2065 domain-containing protein [Deltaproteobacteria bacterium]|nr:DUF2065 domain-containing protein [Deltaproteobacteria bacterium]